MSDLLTDNINSYSDGEIVGQGGWVDHNDGVGHYTVQGTVVKEGAKAIKFDGSIDGDQHTIKVIAAADVPTGKQAVYIRTTSVVTNQLDVFFKANSGDSLFGVRFTGTDIILNRTGEADITVKSGAAADTWYLIEFDWQSSDHKVRMRVDGGSYSAWVLYQASVTEDPRTILLASSGILGAHSDYFDTFAEGAFNPVINAGLFPVL